MRYIHSFSSYICTCVCRFMEYIWYNNECIPAFIFVCGVYVIAHSMCDILDTVHLISNSIFIYILYHTYGWVPVYIGIIDNITKPYVFEYKRDDV